MPESLLVTWMEMMVSPFLRDLLIKFGELVRRGLRGLGDRFGLIHHLIEAGVIQVHILEIGLFSKLDVDGNDLDIEFLFPLGWHIGRAVGYDPQHASISFKIDVLIAELVS